MNISEEQTDFFSFWMIEGKVELICINETFEMMSLYDIIKYKTLKQNLPLFIFLSVFPLLLFLSVLLL
jgi:hypothetical protein